MRNQWRDHLIDAVVLFMLVASVIMVGTAHAQDPMEVEAPYPTFAYAPAPVLSVAIPLETRVAAVETDLRQLARSQAVIATIVKLRESKLERIEDAIDDLKWWLILGGAGSAAAGGAAGRLYGRKSGQNDKPSSFP